MILVLSGSRADSAYLEPVAAGLRAAGASICFERLEGIALAPDADDSPQGLARAAGIVLAEEGKRLFAVRPEMLVVLGDRWEIASACLAAVLADIPVCHIGADERTYGSYDDKFREAISGVAELRFSLHRSPAFGVEAAGCTSVKRPEAPQPADGFAYVMLYPQTRGEPLPLITRTMIIRACEDRNLKPVIFGANLDVGASAYKGFSLPHAEFVRGLASASVVIGNSSAGIIEAPILGTPTVNIGTRQLGRPQAESIFNCDPKAANIGRALDKALAFGKRFVDSPYHNPQAIDIIVRGILGYLANRPSAV